MTKVYGYTEEGKKRVDRAVRAVEQGAGDVTPISRKRRPSWTPLRPAIVQSSTGESGGGPTVRWTYTCKWADFPTEAGYEKWAVSEEFTDSFTAYNLAEELNDGSGRQGNGVDVDSLDIDDDGTDDADFYPIQDGQPVIIWSFYLAASDTMAYWIIGAGMPNGIDGGCP